LSSSPLDGLFGRVALRQALEEGIKPKLSFSEIGATICLGICSSVPGQPAGLYLSTCSRKTIASGAQACSLLCRYC